MGSGGSTWWTLSCEALRDALAVLVPVSCAGCGAPDRPLCSGCRAALTVRGWRRDIDGIPAFAALEYEGPVRRTILALKEHGRTDVARELSRPLEAMLSRVVAGLADAHGGQVRILAAPPSAAARRRRGFEPVTVLLSRSGLRPQPVLRRVRSTAAQKGLTSAHRARNRVGSLAARRDLTGQCFVFADDVVTTGATAREVIRAVNEGGGRVLAVVALAATQRVDGSESSRWAEWSP